MVAIMLGHTITGTAAGRLTGNCATRNPSEDLLPGGVVKRCRHARADGRVAEINKKFSRRIKDLFGMVLVRALRNGAERIRWK